MPRGRCLARSHLPALPPPLLPVFRVFRLAVLVTPSADTFNATPWLLAY